NNINDGDDLPTPVADMDGIVVDRTDDTVDLVDSDVISLVEKLTDDVVCNSIVGLSSRHDLIRKTATNNYLNTANKKIKLHHVYLNNLTEKFDVNDCVGVQIHTIDRTNTDAKLLPCLILEKNRKNDDLVFKLVCQYGKLQSAFSVEILVDLKSACPQELKQLSVDELKDISFIEVCKLYVSGAVSGRACDCYCPCKKANVSCSTKCHSKRGACQNMGD
ncbi:unnamed protein product, partial [Didymodactylos carnosus]